MCIFACLFACLFDPWVCRRAPARSLFLFCIFFSFLMLGSLKQEFVLKLLFFLGGLPTFLSVLGGEILITSAKRYYRKLDIPFFCTVIFFCTRDSFGGGWKDRWSPDRKINGHLSSSNLISQFRSLLGFFCSFSCFPAVPFNSCQVFPGYLTTAHHLYAFSTVWGQGGLAV